MGNKVLVTRLTQYYSTEHKISWFCFTLVNQKSMKEHINFLNSYKYFVSSMQTNKEYQFQDTEYYLSRQAQESSFLKMSNEISFAGKRGEEGERREGRVEKGKGERGIFCENCEAVSQCLLKHLSQDKFCSVSAYTTGQVPLQR